jgi:hypothetical protein
MTPARRFVLAPLALASVMAGQAASAKPPALHVRNGAYLTGLSDTRIEVRVELDDAQPVTIDIRRDPTPQEPAKPGPWALVFRDQAAVAMHVMPVTGLTPATRYEYQVRSGALVLDDGHFTTAPRPDSGAPLTFLVYGDCRTDAAAHASVVREMAKFPADLLVNTGDFVERGGSSEDWEKLFDLEADLLRDHSIISAIGNHELAGDPSGSAFLRYFGVTDGAGGPPRLYGTMRLSNVRFFVLNGRHDWHAGSSNEERPWLEAELAKADAEEGLAWRVVVVHDGPWSVGPHGPNEFFLEARLPELLAAHKVDLIVSGHDHLYERGQSGTLKYLVSGGAGAPLYDVVRDLNTNRKAVAAYHFIEVTTRGDTLGITAWKPDGTNLETCSFKRGGGDWDCDPPRVAAVRPTGPSSKDNPDEPALGPEARPEPKRRTILYGALGLVGMLVAGHFLRRRAKPGPPKAAPSQRG